MAKFKPGQTGNKKGRPPGRPDSRTRYRAMLEPHAPALLEKAVQMALAGEPAALRLCIDRLIPSIKSVSEPVKLALPTDASLSDQAAAVMKAATTGELTTDEAAALAGILQAQVRIIETTELIERLEKLERAAEGGSHE